MSNQNSIAENRDLFIKAYREKNFFKASFLGEELIEQHKKTEEINSYEYCVDLYNVAFFYQKTGNIFKACKFHQENIDFFSNIKKYKENTYSKDYAEIFADIFTSNGICCTKKQDLKNALISFESAYKITNTHLKNTYKYLNCIHNLGCAYFNLQRYDEAITLYLESLDYNKKMDLNYADTLNFLGYCYEEKHDYEKAIYYFNKALPIIKGLEGISSKEYLSNLYYIAGVYEDAKNYQSAINHFEKALNLIESKFGEKSAHITETLNRISNIYIKLKENEKAISISIKALNLIRSSYSENHIFYTNNLKKVADIYFEMEDYKNALKYYEKESKLKKKILGKDSNLYIETLLNLVKVNYKLKNDLEVNNICNKIFMINELNIKDEIYEKTLLLLTKIFTEEKDQILKIYENMKKINPSISLDEMLKKATDFNGSIVQDFYIPRDEEASSHSIEREILTDLRNFLEKSLSDFGNPKPKYEENINKSEKIKKSEKPKTFEESKYTQESILDLFLNKNEDENPDTSL